MLPLFKSHYSVGKSILTLAPPTLRQRESFHDFEKPLDKGPASVFGIAEAHDFSEVILVEDSLIGFLEAKKQAEGLGAQLIFGLRVNVCDDMKVKTKKTSRACLHKIIVFAKDSVGCLLLNRIYSSSETVGKGKIDFKTLKTFYDSEHLKIAIPFYDSFLFHNLFSYKEPCLLDDSFFEPVFFIEDNLLPFDMVLCDAVKEYCAK
jgi:DNA polymerase III alpha subunit